MLSSESFLFQIICPCLPNEHDFYPNITNEIYVNMESQIQEMGKTLFYDLFFFLYIPPPVDIYRHPLLTELDLGYSFNV